ncbi:helicase associated domain-containing protein [Streptomyces violascens]|uniref:helicase associated domain-containing protein n=1 Tax=Streptomyces violascens TaxID=67381 RepID=UPI00367449FC
MNRRPETGVTAASQAKKRPWRIFGEPGPKRLAERGVQARKASTPSGAKAGSVRGAEAFTRGLAALAQYVGREQRTVIPRQHTEQITVDGQDHDVRLGVWVSHQKSRRDQLNEQQLADLGMDWAQTVTVTAAGATSPRPGRALIPGCR